MRDDSLQKINTPLASLCNADFSARDGRSKGEGLAVRLPALPQESNILPVNDRPIGGATQDHSNLKGLDLVETPSSTDKTPTSIMKQAFETYFRSKPFELKNGGEIYENLGVRVFKRFLPTGGDYFNRLFGSKSVQAGGTYATSVAEQALHDREKWTRIYETAHLLGVALMTYNAGVWLYHGDLSTVLGVAMTNSVLNIYPILVQRYNRARITSLLDKIQQRRDSSSSARE